MTREQFKQLMDKLDEIIMLLKAQQGEYVEPIVNFEWVRGTGVVPYEFDRVVVADSYGGQLSEITGT